MKSLFLSSLLKHFNVYTHTHTHTHTHMYICILQKGHRKQISAFVYHRFYDMIMTWLCKNPFKIIFFLTRIVQQTYVVCLGCS